MPSIPAFAKPYSASKSGLAAGASSDEYSSYLRPAVKVNLSETVISSCIYIDERLYSKLAAASAGLPVFALFAKKELALRLLKSSKESNSH